jgi:hypothetical protein
MRTWETVLLESNVDADPAEVDEYICDLFANRFRACTVDDALCMPSEMMAFCGEVRRHFGAPMLHDFDICRRLLNLRKRGSGQFQVSA